MGAALGGEAQGEGARAEGNGFFCDAFSCASGKGAPKRGGDHAERPVRATAEELITTFGSPMHAAAVLGSASDLRALQRAGHNIMGRDASGRTPCHLAALVSLVTHSCVLEICGNLANLQALVELGAEIKTEDYRGNTPLQCAVNTRQVHIVKWVKWSIWVHQDKFGGRSGRGQRTDEAQSQALAHTSCDADQPQSPPGRSSSYAATPIVGSTAMGGGRDLRGGFGVISPTIGTLDVPTTVHSSHGRAAEYDVLPENVGDGEGVSAEARLGSILTLMHPTESWELLHLRATLEQSEGDIPTAVAILNDQLVHLRDAKLS